MLANLSKRERCLFYLVATVILIAISYSFIIEPLAERWKKANENIFIKNMELKKNTKVINEKGEILREFKTFKKWVEAMGANEEEIAALLQEVETIANKISISLTSITPLEVKNEQLYKTYSLKIETEAPMGSLNEFMYHLGKSPHLLKVQDLNIKTVSRKSSNLKITMQITKIVIP